MIRVTATDLDRDPGDSSTCEVEDDYVLAEAMLRAAVAGIELGPYDQVILDWMLTWDQPTLATIASIIRRVGERGPITPEDR